MDGAGEEVSNWWKRRKLQYLQDGVKCKVEWPIIAGNFLTALEKATFMRVLELVVDKTLLRG